MYDMLIIGIDDAGRGPLIGPMFLAGVLLKKKDDAHLRQEGVVDSKVLSQAQRVRLAGIIKDASINYHIVETSPEQIDHSLTSGINLNTLEAMKSAEIINKLNRRNESIKVIIDCPSVNKRAWHSKLLSFIHHPENLEIYCEHKADVHHPSVSAASILAKVAREEAVAKLKEKYGDIGSGYPSDPQTILFLNKYGKKLEDSGIFRKSWATWKALFPGASQRTLGEF